MLKCVFIELVDYNDNMSKDIVAKKSPRTRRSKKVVNADSTDLAQDAQSTEENNASVE